VLSEKKYSERNKKPQPSLRRRLISVCVVLSMFTMILIDSYHVVFLERYNSLVSGNSFPRFSKKQINQFSDSKLKLYNICKSNFGLEKYLTIVNNFELRRSFTKLRTSSHRYQGVPRHNRVCTKCFSNVK
jgi:hypothetical protein